MTKDCKTSLRHARFIKQFERLRPFLTSTEVETLNERIEWMLAKDGRHPIFQIEGLSKLYEYSHDKPYAKVRSQTKELEDVLGKYDAQSQYLAFAVKVDAPANAVQYLAKKKEKAADDLKKILKPWMRPREEDNTTRFQRNYDRILGIPVLSEADDIRESLKGLIHLISEIEETNFNMRQLQKGIHELRRRIRWIAIMLQSMNGLVLVEDGEAALPKSVVDEYSFLLTSPIASGPFGSIPVNPEVKHPVKIHRLLYLAISHLIVAFGDIKSFAENFEALEEAIIESDPKLGMDREKVFSLAERLVERQGLHSYDWIKAAQDLKNQMDRSQVLKTIRKELQAALGSH